MKPPSNETLMYIGMEPCFKTKKYDLPASFFILLTSAPAPLCLSAHGLVHFCRVHENIITIGDLSETYRRPIGDRHA